MHTFDNRHKNGATQSSLYNCSEGLFSESQRYSPYKTMNPSQGQESPYSLNLSSTFRTKPRDRDSSPVKDSDVLRESHTSVPINNQNVLLLKVFHNLRILKLLRIVFAHFKYKDSKYPKFRNKITQDAFYKFVMYFQICPQLAPKHIVKRYTSFWVF